MTKLNQNDYSLMKKLRENRENFYNTLTPQNLGQLNLLRMSGYIDKDRNGIHIITEYGKSQMRKFESKSKRK
jgi:hypothetical protein